MKNKATFVMAALGTWLAACPSPAFALQQIAAGKHASHATVVEASHPVPGHLLFESIEFNSDGSLYVKGPRVHYEGQLRKFALDKDPEEPAEPYESAGGATMANAKYICGSLGPYTVKDDTHMQLSKAADPSQLVAADPDEPQLSLVSPSEEVNHKVSYHYVALEGINCRHLTKHESCMAKVGPGNFPDYECWGK